MRKLISTRTTGIYRFIRAFNTNLLQSLMPKQNLLLRLNIYDTSNISSKRWFFVSPNFIDYREFLTPIRIPNTINETNDRVDRPKFAKICREIYRIFVLTHLSLHRSLHKLHRFESLSCYVKKENGFDIFTFSFLTSHSPREIFNRRGDSNFLISSRFLRSSTIRSIDFDQF